jgi:hypothetical protein
MHISRIFGRLTILSLLLYPCFSYAQFWQGANTYSAGHGAVGAFGQFYFQPNEFMAFGQGIYGVSNSFQLEGRLGLGSLDPYWGAFGKYEFLSRKVLEMALFFGLHHQSVSYVDVGLILSHSFSKFQLYVGPLCQVPLQNGLPVGLSIIPGVSIGVGKRARVYSEVNLNTNDSYSAASAGVRWSL